MTQAFQAFPGPPGREKAEVPADGSEGVPSADVLEALVAGAGIPLFLADGRGALRAASPALTALLGPEGSAAALRPDLDPPEAEDWLRTALAGGRAVEVETLWSCPDGSRCPVRLGLMPLGSDRALGWAWDRSGDDLVAHRLAESASLNRHLAAGIYALSLAHRVDEALEALLGRAAAVFPAPHWCVVSVEGLGGDRRLRMAAWSTSMAERFGETLRELQPPIFGGTFSRDVFDRRVLCLVRDAAAERDRIHPSITEGFGLRSLLGVPLVFEGRTLGALLAVAFRGEAPLAPGELQLGILQSLCQIGGLALNRIGARHQLELQAERLARLNLELGRFQKSLLQVAHQRDLPAVLAMLLAQAAESAGLDACEIYLADAARGRLESVASVGFTEQFRELTPSLPIGGAEGCVSGEAASRESLVVVEEVAEEPRLAPYLEAFREAGLRSTYAVPLKAQEGELLGTFTVYRRNPGAPTEDELAQVEAFAALASVAVERSRLWGRLGEELALRTESEALYRTLVEKAQLGVYLAQDGRLVYANPALHRMFGWEPGRLEGRPSLDLVHPGDRDRVQDAIRRRRAEGSGTVIAFRGIRQDGTAFAVEVFGTKVLLGSRPAVLGLVQDVSDRELAQETLRGAVRQSEQLALATQDLAEAGTAAEVRERLMTWAGRLAPLPHWWFNRFDAAAGTLETVGWTRGLEELVGRAALEAHTEGRTELRDEVHLRHQVVYVPRCERNRRFEGEAPVALARRTYLAVPLVHGGECVGSLCGGSFGTEGHRFLREDQVQALQSLAGAAALALRRIQAETLQKRDARLATTLADATRDLAAAAEEGDLMRRLFRWGRHLVPYPVWYFNHYDPSRRTSVTTHWTPELERYGTPEEIRHPSRVDAVPALVRLYEQRQVLHLAAVEPGADVPEAVLARWPLQSLTRIPLSHHGEVFGVLTGACMGGHPKVPVGGTEVQALQSLAEAAGLVLHRLRAQRALAQREAEFRQLFEQAPDAILLLDGQGRILQANAAAAALYGAGAEALAGRPLPELAPPEQPGGGCSWALIRSHLEAALAGGNPRFEWAQRRLGVPEDAAVFPSEVSLTALDRPEGAVLHAIVRDLTPLRRAELERADLERRFFQAQKLESLGILAGGIAHDFNNLLMGILGHAGLAMDQLGQLHPVHRNLEALQKAGQRAADLTRQLLAYSGKGHFMVKALDLTVLVDEMAHLLELSVPKSVAMTLDLGAGLPAVEADAAQLQQVVMNLAINAAEAIGEGPGQITLTTGIQALGPGDLEQAFVGQDAAPGDYVLLQVADTGCGMDPATLARIFEPFFTTKFTGRGLGLSAIMGIVRGHKGVLRVQSEPGRGTTFQVFLPAAPAAVEPERRPDPAAWSGTGTVLVVDDDDTVRAVARQILEMHGFGVLEAAHGLQGLDVFRSHAEGVSLVLLDMTMPQMGGEAAFHRLRELRPGVQVVLSSGYSEQEAMGRFTGQGLAGFLQKPYGPRELIAKVREALGAGKEA